MEFLNQFKLKMFLLIFIIALHAKRCQTDYPFHHIEQKLNIKLINYLPKVWFKYIRLIINHVIHDKKYSLKPLQMLLKNKYHVCSAIYSKLNQPDDTSNHTDMCYFYYTCYLNGTYDEDCSNMFSDLWHLLSCEEIIDDSLSFFKNIPQPMGLVYVLDDPTERKQGSGISMAV